MSDIKQKLESLLTKEGLMTGAQWRRKIEDLERRRAEGEFEIDKVVAGTLVGDDESGFYLVRTDLPLDTRHGSVPLGAITDTIAEQIAFSACDADLEQFDASRAIFIDAETTGLAGGTGTVAFLVGVGYLTEDVFRLDQCFMRDFDDEEPMLEFLDDLFQGRDAVVSFNGKSFDLPLLRTRFIQNRRRFPLENATHFDLLHAARRFWKLRLQDCSLGNIEQHVLGIRRHGDVPSAEIPQIWLDYLRTGDARKLDRVFYHHRMDVLSLVALTAWLSRTLNPADDQEFQYTQDRLSLIRLHFRHRRYGDVAELGRSMLESEAEAAFRCECLQLVGFAHKRLGAWHDMEEAFRLLLQESPRNLVARLELAKLYEHRLRDLLAAERLCEETVQLLTTRSALHGDLSVDDPHLDAFAHRLDRIRGKLSRARPRSDEE